MSQVEQSVRHQFFERGKTFDGVESPITVPDFTETEFNYALAMCQVDEVTEVDKSVRLYYHFSSVKAVVGYYEGEIFNDALWNSRYEREMAMQDRGREIQEEIVKKLDTAMLEENLSVAASRIDGFLVWIEGEEWYVGRLTDIDIIKLVRRQANLEEILSREPVLVPNEDDEKLVRSVTG